jgi:Winged helix DNA-binding domain
VPATTITAAGLNRATLGRQLLLERGALGVEDAARRVVAIQAQQPASPYIALWNRLAGFDPADLDAAFTSRRLVKATLMRFTLHVVHASDHLALHTAMQPTLRSRLADPRYHGSGLRPADADGVIAELLAFASQPGTKAEAEEALQTLVQRYLAGFGPASVADVAQFALVQRSRARGRAAGPFRHPGAAGRARWHRALRHPRRAPAARGHAGAAEAAADVGQHPARLCGPQPRHPT